MSWLAAAIGCWFALWIGAATAHEMSMAELELREVAKGEFIWNWGASGKSRPIADDLTPSWPAGCVATGTALKCAVEHGLSGPLGIAGVGKAYSAALVRIHWLDGQSRVYTITSAQPQVMLYGGADDLRSGGEILRAYTVLGIEHILGGIDHLLFVLCLLFLVGFNRRLLWTITAFTAAHSLTLILSALGWLTLRAAPVEATIALSIMLMASEALRRDDTLTRRLPAVVAFVFGLVHGLGFAGALKDIGLPQHHLVPALLTFNVGVEIGQLLTVALAWVAARMLRGHAYAGRLSQVALYGIGGMAAYWSLLRVVRIFA